MLLEFTWDPMGLCLIPAELLPRKGLKDHKWDEEEIEEATGNEGATMERWYHHAALVIWLHSSHRRIACTYGLNVAQKVCAVV
jgi:hypothetical protein